MLDADLKREIDRVLFEHKRYEVEGSQEPVSLACLLRNSLVSVYVGMTGQKDVKNESYRWLTQRGSNEQHLEGGYTGNRNRPVLRWPDGKCIRMSQAETQLGLQTVVAVEVTVGCLRTSR